MCGRYASARRKRELLEEFQVELDGDPEAELAPDYNVAPTKPVYAVLSRARRPGARAVRQLRVVRWGLVPPWAKEPSIGSRMINARLETVAEKPAFRQAFARRRCLLPADGYFEWTPVEGDRGRRKQPYYIHPADGGVLAMAGLYEFWQDSTRAVDDPLRWLVTAAVITTVGEGEAGRVHDRMPMTIEPARWAEWLDPELTGREANDLLAPVAAGRLVAHPVSTEVNSVRNNGPGLVEPLPPAVPPEEGVALF